MMDLLPEVESDDENYTVMFADGRSFYLKTYQGTVQITMYTDEMRKDVLCPIGDDWYQDSEGENHRFVFELTIGDDNV